MSKDLTIGLILLTPALLCILTVAIFNLVTRWRETLTIIVLLLLYAMTWFGMVSIARGF
jgi:hypothetical protein